MFFPQAGVFVGLLQKVQEQSIGLKCLLAQGQPTLHVRPNLTHLANWAGLIITHLGFQFTYGLTLRHNKCITHSGWARTAFAKIWAFCYPSTAHI